MLRVLLLLQLLVLLLLQCLPLLLLRRGFRSPRSRYSRSSIFPSHFIQSDLAALSSKRLLIGRLVFFDMTTPTFLFHVRLEFRAWLDDGC